MPTPQLFTRFKHLLCETRTKATKKARPKLRFNTLEDRVNPTSTLFVDFGDNFPAGALTGITVGDFTGTTGASTSSPFNNAGDTLRIDSFATALGANAAAVRADIMSLVRRFYEPFDITVVDLTAAAQNVNSYNVQAAMTVNDIANTLALNNGDVEHNDAYIVIGRFFVNGTNPYPNGGGVANGDDIYNYNNNDGTAVAGLHNTPTAGSMIYYAQTVAHEAGHLFGLLHVYKSGDGSEPNINIPSTTVNAELLTQSELMSYSDVQNTSSMFMRYPTIAGDDFVSNNDYDTLSAFDNKLSTAGQMLADNNIGPSNIEYATGTGAHDIITVTRVSATQGNVAVQAFTDNNYATAITVPNIGGTTFSYSIDLTKPLTIDGGAGDDRIIIAADLGVTVTVRGMDDSDSLVVLGTNSGTATYTPSTHNTNAIDNTTDNRGSVSIGATTVNFIEFESASSLVTLRNISNAVLQLSAGMDNVSATNDNGNTQFEGTISGVNFVPLVLDNVNAITVSGGGGDDSLTIANDYVAAAGFSLHFNGEGNNDRLRGDDSSRVFSITGLNSGTLSGPQNISFSGTENLVGGSQGDAFNFNAGGSLTGTINGGGGTDTITGDNTARTFTITGANVGTVSTLLPAGFTNVENLVGGTAGDSFTFASGGSLTGTIDGGGGTDTLTGDDNARTFTITGANAGNVSTVLTNGFTNIENLVGGSQGDAFNFNAGGSLTGTINGGGGTDTITGDNTARTFTITGANAGTISTLLPAGFTNVENLAGGTAGDSFIFNTGGSLTGTINGGGGTDTITGDNSARTYNITGANAGAIPTLLPAGFTNVENLVGGTADDTFVFGGAGSLTGTIDGGTGGDLIDGNDAPHTYTINGANAGTVSELLPAGFTNVESLVGGTGVDQFTFVVGGSLTGTINGDAGNDTLTGDNAARTFTITAANGGNVSTILTNGFTNVENLVGGTADDSFLFNAGGSLTGTINGGDGTDTITGDNTARTFTITLPNAGNVSVILPAGFTNVENLAGGTAGDTFTFNNGGSLTGTIDGNGGNDIINGDDGGRTFTLTALNQGTISDILPAGFSDVETLNGGIGADSFVVANNNGAIDGFFDGKGNVDTVDLSLKTVAQLIVVQTSSVNGFNTTGGTAATGGFRDIDRLFGSTTATTDRLTGLAENANWQVRAGADQSFYRLTGSGRTLFFDRFEVLIGSTKTDTFTVDFSAGNPLSAAGLTVAGMGGTDTLKAIGTANADNFKLLSQQLHVNGNVIRFTTMEYVDSYGGAGNDAFYSPGTAVLSSLKLIRFYGEAGNDLALVDPKTTTPYYLHGGDGTDKLTVNRGSARFKTPLPPRNATSGTYNFTNRKLIQFISFETIDIGVLQPQP